MVEPNRAFTAPLTFPCLGVILRHTLRISRESSLAVPDHQRQVGECIFCSASGQDLLLLSVLGSATCVVLAHCIPALSFSSARSDNRFARSDSDWAWPPSPSRFVKNRTSVELSSTTHLRAQVIHDLLA